MVRACFQLFLSRFGTEDLKELYWIYVSESIIIVYIKCLVLYVYVGEAFSGVFCAIHYSGRFYYPAWGTR